MSTFNFEQAFENVKTMDSNWYLMIQVLESRVMAVIYEKSEDLNRFKSKIQQLTWEEREINVIEIAQKLFDIAMGNIKKPYTEYRDDIRRTLKGIYADVAVRMEMESGMSTEVR